MDSVSQNCDVDYIRVHGIGQKEQNRQRANDAAFLDVQLFAAIMIALPEIFFHLARPHE